MEYVLLSLGLKVAINKFPPGSFLLSLPRLTGIQSCRKYSRTFMHSFVWFDFEQDNICWGRPCGTREQQQHTWLLVPPDISYVEYVFALFGSESCNQSIHALQFCSFVMSVWTELVHFLDCRVEIAEYDSVSQFMRAAKHRLTHLQMWLIIILTLHTRKY